MSRINRRLLFSQWAVLAALFIPFLGGGVAHADPTLLPVDININLSAYLNKPNMPAALDANGNDPNPVLSPRVTIGSSNGGVAYPVFYAGQDLTAVFGSPFSGSTAIQIGGTPLKDVPGSPLGIWAGLPQNLIIGGNPDGPYNNGCSLCVFTQPSYQNTMIAELGGDNYLTTKIPTGFDVAGIFWNAGANPAKLILDVDSYTQTSVVLKRKLTEKELLLIHQGQYIVTNSLADGQTVESSVSDRTQFLAGIVKSVDNSGAATIINVYAWNRQGDTGSVIPSTTSFDTFYFPGSKSPTVWVGAPTKMFSFNTMMEYDGAKAGASGQAQTVIHSEEWGEVDVNVQNETRPHMLSYHGLTFGGSQTVPRGATIRAKDVFAPDSYEMLLANEMPHHLIITGGCGDMEIETSGFKVPGQCNLLRSDGNGTQLMSELRTASYDSKGYNYNWRLLTYLSASSPTEAGAAHYTHDTLHLSARIDGDMGTITGSALGDIQFNGDAGITLCAYGNRCGFNLNNNADVHMTGNVTVDKQMSVGAQLAAKNNFVVEGTTYYQDSAGANHIQMAMQTQGQLRIDSTDGGRSNILYDIPTQFTYPASFDHVIVNGSNSNQDMMGIDFSLGDSKATGYKLGATVVEFSDRFHLENTLGYFNSTLTDSHPTITTTNDHSWLTYRGAYDFFSYDGVATVQLVMSVNDTATTILNKVVAPEGSFDTLSAKTPGGTINITSPITISQLHVGSVSETTQEGVEAKGSSYDDAGSPTGQLIVVTKASEGSGIKLPSLPAGTRITILNRTTTAITVYPETKSDSIESESAGAGVTVAPMNTSFTIERTGATQFRIL